MTFAAARSLEIFYFDAGGGHRNAAYALKDVIADQYPHWQVDLVDLHDILEPLDLIHSLTGVKAEDVYNGILKRGWTYGSLAILRGMQKTIKLNAARIENLLQRHWLGSRPGIVVSVIPNFNRPMFRALRRAHPETPYVTVMTDFADCPPSFWQEKQDQFLICGTGMAVSQAEAAGYGPERIFRTSGMILSPNFYAGQTSDRRAERAKLGLDPDLPTALIMYGGFGAKVSAKILKRLRLSGLPVQSIVMCGHNDDLLRGLRGVEACHAVGFTDDVPYYMHLADFFIGKPGPGSISEALHMGLPVIIERNARTMPQERPNADWIEEHNLGLVIGSFREIAAAVRRLLDENRLRDFRQRAQALDNHAVFEIPPILERIMAAHAERRDSGRDLLPALTALSLLDGGQGAEQQGDILNRWVRRR